MVEYSKINCKLTNIQLNKLKKAVKSNEGATLRLGIKILIKMNFRMNYELIDKILNYVMLLIIIWQLI